MNRIRLNDGTEYPVEYCGLSDNVVGFRIAAPGTLEQNRAEQSMG